MTIPAEVAGLRVRVRLRDTARVLAGADGTTRLVCGSGGQSFGTLTPGQRRALDALGSGDHEPEDLLTTAAGNVSELSAVYALLSGLGSGDWLAATLVGDGGPVLTILPTGGRPTGTPRSVADLLRDVLAGTRPGEHVPGPLVLSRFALLRRDGDRLLLESPRGRFAVWVRDPAVLALIGGLVDTPPVGSAAGSAVRSAAGVVTGVLAACGLAVPVDPAEDADLELAQWSPHELWFHARSRQGRHDLPWGATYWARDRFDPLPARPERPAGPTYDLPTPDLDTVAARDPRLTDVLEGRRSVRGHDTAAPLTAARLGEFLYRTARTRRTWVQDGVELADRPYPSGGALHELEIYPVVGDVAGVRPGLYHYDGQAHRLELVTKDDPLLRRLVGQAAAAARMTGSPQVLFVITARFGRVMWKYRSMGYALTLKNVGVLMSTMYLVATAMNLAPCALGGGDSDLFARAAGLAYESESSVGEFLLGSAPGGSPANHVKE